MPFPHMLGLATEHFEVFGTVITLIAVDMMYHLSGAERATEHFFSHYSVLVSLVVFAVGLALSSIQECFARLLPIRTTIWV